MLKKLISGIIASTVLFISSCAVGNQSTVVDDITDPQFVIICKTTVDNGAYIWKKDCIILVRQGPTDK